MNPNHSSGDAPSADMSYERGGRERTATAGQVGWTQTPAALNPPAQKKPKTQQPCARLQWICFPSIKPLDSGRTWKMRTQAKTLQGGPEEKENSEWSLCKTHRQL